MKGREGSKPSAFFEFKYHHRDRQSRLVCSSVRRFSSLLAVRVTLLEPVLPNAGPSNRSDFRKSPQVRVPRNSPPSAPCIRVPKLPRLRLGQISCPKTECPNRGKIPAPPDILTLPRKRKCDWRRHQARSLKPAQSTASLASQSCLLPPREAGLPKPSLGSLRLISHYIVQYKVAVDHSC